LSDALLIKADIAASVFSQFQTLPEPISVAACLLVMLGVREMA